VTHGVPYAAQNYRVAPSSKIRPIRRPVLHRLRNMPRLDALAPRQIRDRDGQRVMKLAELKKSIYSLFPDLASVSHAANDRYIHFLSAIDDPTTRPQGSLEDFGLGRGARASLPRLQPLRR